MRTFNRGASICDVPNTSSTMSTMRHTVPLSIFITGHSKCCQSFCELELLCILWECLTIYRWRVEECKFDMLWGDR